MKAQPALSFRREHDIGLRKLVDKLEKLEVTMKLEETEN